MEHLFVGVVGYCPPTKFDEAQAVLYLQNAYDKVQQDFCNRSIIIVSGLTNCGVIKLAYEEAQRHGWKTMGIACKKAYAFADWFPVSMPPVIIGESWGDESQFFIDCIDALIRVGGGKQSLRETDLARRLGKIIFEYDLPILP